MWNSWGPCEADTVDEGNYTLLYSGCGTFGDYVGQTVKDTVDEGNYTYYTLKQPGPLELVLTTFQGNTYRRYGVRPHRFGGYGFANNRQS